MIKIYTDGSSRGNPGLGGWAVVVFKDDKYITYRAGYFPDVTNNRMELTAIRNALVNVKDWVDKGWIEENELVEIYSDSAYCVNAVNTWMLNWQKNGWTRDKGKEVKNLDLFKELYDLYYDGTTNISIKKTAGHCGIIGNELADALCSNKKDKIKEYLIQLGGWNDIVATRIYN